MKVKINIKLLVIAVILAVCGVLIQRFIGNVYIFDGYWFGGSLLLVQIPVFLCGLICGSILGAVCGAIIPLICSLVFSSYSFNPTALILITEFVFFGLVSGFLYKKLKQNVYVSLILAMVFGKIAYGIISYLLLLQNGDVFTGNDFVYQTALDCIPGIVLQLAAVPAVVIILTKIGLIDKGEK